MHRADEMEDFDDSFSRAPKSEAIILPTAPRAARGPENLERVPKEPPYTAYIANLSYDVDTEVVCVQSIV